MSVVQNLAYSVVQVAHNFGAVATTGGSVAAVKLRATGTRRKLAWLVLAGWGTQAASGAIFGAVSHYFYHQFPDISGLALTALIIKMACAAAGFLLLAVYLLSGANWAPASANRAWFASTVLAATALTAAAFLRWFS
jgi:hypothetical protein